MYLYDLNSNRPLICFMLPHNLIVGNITSFQMQNKEKNNRIRYVKTRTVGIIYISHHIASACDNTATIYFDVFGTV